MAESSGVATSIGVDDRPRDDNFGLRFSGWIEAPADGRYTFHLRSDDGSRLHLDGEVVVDNGGVHAPRTRSAEVDLSRGSTRSSWRCSRPPAARRSLSSGRGRGSSAVLSPRRRSPTDRCS